MFTDQQMETWMGHLLRAGVLIAATVVLIGGVLYLHQKRGPRPDYSTFHATAPEFRHVSSIPQKVFTGDAAAIIQLGLLLLIATPVARVAFAIVGFFAEKDWLYVVVSVIVFGVLMYSLFSHH